jgi:hypothetical protein
VPRIQPVGRMRPLVSRVVDTPNKSSATGGHTEQVACWSHDWWTHRTSRLLVSRLVGDTKTLTNRRVDVNLGPKPTNGNCEPRFELQREFCGSSSMISNALMSNGRKRRHVTRNGHNVAGYSSLILLVTCRTIWRSLD